MNLNKTIWSLIAICFGSLAAFSQANDSVPQSNNAAAIDCAKRAQEAAQSALKTRDIEDFNIAKSNILHAISLVPTNQEYLVAATTYLDWKTRFTSQKELEGYKFAEQSIRLSKGQNPSAYLQAAKALEFIGYPAKAFIFAQRALKSGKLNPEDQKAAQRIIDGLVFRTTVLWNTLDTQEIRQEPAGLAKGNQFFYYPVPPELFINQTAEYSVLGAFKWDRVESNGDTFLRIWPGAGAIQIKIVVTRFQNGRKVIVEDHSSPLPPEAAAFTNSTRFINASAPEIQSEAKTLRRENWVDTIKAICKYVNQGWNYVATGISSETSTTLLNTRTGMCMDEANLCVALARANGIPARMVHGCEAYNEGSKFTGLTTGHQWCEAYIPGTGWCEFVSDADCFGWMPWFCIRWYWQDTEVFRKKKWGSNTSESLDLPLRPPLINEEMERTKYILWLGMTDESINQIGTRWHMSKNW